MLRGSVLIVRSILLLILIVCASFTPPAASARGAPVTTLAFVEADLDQNRDAGQQLTGHSRDWSAADHSHEGGAMAPDRCIALLAPANRWPALTARLADRGASAGVERPPRTETVF